MHILLRIHSKARTLSAARHFHRELSAGISAAPPEPPAKIHHHSTSGGVEPEGEGPAVARTAGKRELPCPAFQVLAGGTRPRARGVEFTQKTAENGLCGVAWARPRDRATGFPEDPGGPWRAETRENRGFALLNMLGLAASRRLTRGAFDR